MKKALLMVAGAILSVQIGAALAKSVFPLTGALGMTWIRLVCAGAILLCFARPDVRHRPSQAWWALAGYSAALVGMNIAIYQAMARIPLGMAVTIEFLGPLAVSVLTRKGWRDLLWVVLAGIGVVLLGWSPGSLTWAGVGFALLAGLCWGLYILVTPVAGAYWKGAQAVTAANVAGAVVLTVPVLMTVAHAFASWHVWAFGLGVGLLSSVVPYALELQALRHLERRVFSILMSIEPAVAALAALVILHERLGWVECVAMGCVIVASAGITWTAAPHRPLKRISEDTNHNQLEDAD